MKTTLSFALLISCTLAGAVATDQQPARDADEPLVNQVRSAIDRGVAYLKSNQNLGKGHWEEKGIAGSNVGGATALALLALLNAGVGVDDQNVKAGLNYMRSIDNPATYVLALQTMVLVEAGQTSDLGRIKQNVDLLLKNKSKDRNEKLTGWSYGIGGLRGSPDNSNTQYAVLALWMAQRSGVAIPEAKKFWEEVRDYYTETQQNNGGWLYANDNDRGAFNEVGTTLTMTVAGLSGLLVAQMELNADREKLDPVEICGKYEENKVIKAALAWISTPPPGLDRFSVQLDGRVFYNLYGIERLGRLSGQRFLGMHDWYREGCAFLVKAQKQDGSWLRSGSKFDDNPIISTSFAVLFLSKGRTPVLISKLAHGRTPRQDNDQDWNRRRNDLRHLVEFASETVFHKLPLAWQNFDMRRQPIITQDKVHEITADLLQSPILYITGHESPAKRLDLMEKARLREYVDNGGFILAVACCGSREFNEGFHELCQELWPYNELTSLEADHPVWNMRFEVQPGSFGLKGIQQGCKTVAILSQQNMCGYWEINRRTGEGETAFQLGANIVAYATGLEPPKARLTQFVVTTPAKDSLLGTPPRGYFQVGQLISKMGEKAAWKPAPEAMSKLTQNLREFAGLDAVLKTADVPIDDPNLTNYKFLYMHGRNDFKFTSKQLEKLRFNLKNGGLLLADACCGKEAFDKAFRQFINDLFPADVFPAGEAPRLVPIKADDALFSKELNGDALSDFNIQCRTERGTKARPMRPALEGVKIGSRWVVIYSKYDIGCALEKHQSADCIGYNYDSALRLGRAAVLYHFWLEPRR